MQHNLTENLMFIYLRHPATGDNEKGLVAGQASQDRHMSPQGFHGYQQPLAHLIEIVRGASNAQNIYIVNTGMTRSVQGAELLRHRLSKIDVAVRTIEIINLQERHYGKWEGQSWDEPAEASSNLTRRNHIKCGGTPPLGESETQVDARVQPQLESIKSLTGIVIVIGHSSIFKSLCRVFHIDAADLSLKDGRIAVIRDLKQPNLQWHALSP